MGFYMPEGPGSMTHLTQCGLYILQMGWIQAWILGPINKCAKLGQALALPSPWTALLVSAKSGAQIGWCGECLREETCRGRGIRIYFIVFSSVYYCWDSLGRQNLQRRLSGRFLTELPDGFVSLSCCSLVLSFVAFAFWYVLYIPQSFSAFPL